MLSVGNDRDPHWIGGRSVIALRFGAAASRAARDGKSIVVAFVKLDAIGWYYVVEVDGTSLGAVAP